MAEIDSVVDKLISDLEDLSLKTKNKTLTKCRENKQMSRLDLFKLLGEFNSITKSTRIVNVAEFVGDYSRLYQKNGGLARGWDRWYKVLKVKNNKAMIYSWEPSDEEVSLLTKEVNEYLELNSHIPKPKGGPTTHHLLKLCGEYKTNTNRPIRKDIKDFYLKQPCVVCGSTSALVCDHKNDLYNDTRVLSTKTQTLTDFQSLCTHCNLQKRQIAKETRRTGLRWGATNIPSLKKWGINFTQGGETYDPLDPHAMVGTYWYDPVQFHKDVLKIAFKRTTTLTTHQSTQFSSSCP